MNITIQDASDFVKRLQESVGRDKVRAIMNVIRKRHNLKMETIIRSVSNFLRDESAGPSLMISFSSFLDSEYQEFGLNLANEMTLNNNMNQDLRNDPEFMECVEALVLLKNS